MEKAVIELGGPDPYLDGFRLQRGDAGDFAGQCGREDVPLVIVEGDLFLCHNKEFLGFGGRGSGQAPIPLTHRRQLPGGLAEHLGHLVRVPAGARQPLPGLY